MPDRRILTAAMVVAATVVVLGLVLRVLYVADSLGNDAQAQCVDDGYSVAYCVDAR